MKVLALVSALSFFEGQLPPEQQQQALCLTEIIHYEANGEGWAGKKAVANVALTREEGSRFPDTLCRVLKAPSAFSHRNQGLGLGDVVITEPGDLRSFKETLELVVVALEGDLRDNTLGADHFYNPTHVNPNWARNPIIATRIGQHRFIKLYRE